MVADGGLGRGLQPRLQGRVDLQTSLEQRLPPVRVGWPEPRVVQELVDHVPHPEGLSPDRVGQPALRRELDLRPARLRVLLGGDPAIAQQAIQDDLPARSRRGPMTDGVQGDWRGDHPREQRCFRQREVLDGLGEVELRGRSDPVHAIAQVDLVQVQLEDLVLRVALLQADGVLGLGELAGERLGRAGLGVLHELLGDRRSPLDDAAGSEVGHGGPDDRGHIQRAVSVELVILDGQHGLPCGLVDLGERDVHPVLVLEQGGQDGSVGGVDRGAFGQGRQSECPLARFEELIVELGDGPPGTGDGGKQPHRHQGSGHEDDHRNDQTYHLFVLGASIELLTELHDVDLRLTERRTNRRCRRRLDRRNLQLH